MPGASSMRGVTGFRILDALNGALAQLIPDRVPAAGEGGNTLAIFGADRPAAGDRFVFYELVVGTWGGTPTADGNDGLTNPPASPRTSRSRWPSRSSRSSSSATGSSPTRAARRASRGPRDRARVALPHARDLADRSLRPRRPTALRARGGGQGGRRATCSFGPTARRRYCPRCSRPRSRQVTSTSHRMAGGGGWGDPFERDPEAVGRRRE